VGNKVSQTSARFLDRRDQAMGVWTGDEEGKLVALVHALLALTDTGGACMHGSLSRIHDSLWQAAEDSNELPGRTADAIRKHFDDVRKLMLSDVPEGDEGFYAQAFTGGPVTAWTGDEEGKLVALVLELKAKKIHTGRRFWQAAEDSKELPGRTADAMMAHFYVVRRKFMLSDVSEGDEVFYAEAFDLGRLPSCRPPPPGRRPSCRPPSPQPGVELAGCADMGVLEFFTTQILGVGSGCGAHLQQLQGAGSEGGGVASTLQSDDGSAHDKHCHFCQHVKVKRASSMIACENHGCPRRFCERCLSSRIADQAGTYFMSLPALVVNYVLCQY
jgi:hypothetical protein